MNKIRKHIIERYDIVTRPGDREAMDKYGYWLDPAETRFVDGVTYYRAIYPGSKKGGWASNYETPVAMHLKDPLSSINNRKPR